MVILHVIYVPIIRAIMSQATNCRFCGKSFSKTYQCSVHKKLHAFKFSSCAKEFYSKTDLQQHEVDHVEFKRICKICNETLIGEESYEIHREMHDRLIYEETKKYTCENCGRLYEYRKALKTHRSKCDNKSSLLQCDLCTAKSFKCKSDLERHVRTHTSEYVVICEFCNKGFFRKSQLLAHLRSHLVVVNDYPFQCKDCGATFAKKYNLKRHASRVHAGETPVTVVQDMTVEEDRIERNSLLIGLKLEKRNFPGSLGSVDESE